MQQALDFLVLYAACYAGMLALYFGQGWVMLWLNARHPERRIQPERDGSSRARVEIIQSVKSLLVTSFCLAGGIFVQLQGWTLFPAFKLSIWSFAAMFMVSIVLFDAWFYWFHRLMHTRLFYRHHLWHHRSVAPTVWSNYSDSLADAFVMQSYYLIAPMVLPLHPVVLIAHRLYDHINGQIGHSGFEYFSGPAARFPSPFVCTTFHDQHHEKFQGNYANFFSVWDRICGTLDPDYETKSKRLERANSTPPEPT